MAEQDGHRLGFASVSTNDNFLHNLFVDPNYQSLGVGHVLLEHVQKTFTSTGSLKCLVKNERRLRFTSATAGTLRRREILRTESII